MKMKKAIIKKCQPDKKEFIKLLNHYGYQFDSTNEYYINNDIRSENNGKIGVKVGEFSHSCHVDSSDILVLLFIKEDGKTEVEEVWDIWTKKE